MHPPSEKTIPNSINLRIINLPSIPQQRQANPAEQPIIMQAAWKEKTLPNKRLLRQLPRLKTALPSKTNQNNRPGLIIIARHPAASLEKL